MIQSQRSPADMLGAASNRVRSLVADCINACKAIKWKTMTFRIPIAPGPSHRPRLSGYRVYVPGAAKNQSFY